jgi:hypothetical protein
VAEPGLICEADFEKKFLRFNIYNLPQLNKESFKPVERLNNFYSYQKKIVFYTLFSFKLEKNMFLMF